MSSPQPFVVLAVALALGSACKSEAPLPEPAPTPAATTATEEPALPEAAANPTATPAGDPEGWQRQSSPEGGYSVLAPTAGLVQTTTTSTQAGPAPTTTVIYQREGDPGALMVMYMDMPVKDGTPLAIERGLEEGRDRAVGTYNGTLVRDERITVDGNPAREFEFDATIPQFGPVHSIMRGVFRGKRVYMVGAVSGRGDSDFGAKGATFVRSFQITPVAE